MTNRLFKLAAISLVGALVAACTPTRAPIRPIDHACLPAGTSPADIALYRQDIDAEYLQIAYLDSFFCQDPGEKEVKDMLDDLKAKARIAGADAVIRVKMLSDVRSGALDNPRTPFRSMEQGEWKEKFFRGIAIKYLRQPEGEPAAVPEHELGPPPVEQARARTLQQHGKQKTSSNPMKNLKDSFSGGLLPDTSTKTP